MVHLSDLSWDKAGDEAIRDYKKGDQVKVKVLDVDIDKERISLGIKQLENDPFENVGTVAKKGDVVTVIVAGIQDNGIDVTVSDGIPGFIRKSELSRDRSEQRPDRYAIGDKLDAKITNIDRASRRVVLSVKARELDEEKKAMADFGSSDSGASLGDILGAALSRAQKKDE
jgi:small subunit ribosomal protein S1